MGWLILTLVLIVIALLYKWSVAKYNILNDRNVPHAPPLPLLGNVPIKGILGRLPFLQLMVEQHLGFKYSKVYGMYALRDPIYFIRDAELIKTIGIKAFDHFVNHNGMHQNLHESILSKSLISLKDNSWRQMRHTLTPTFSGSKIRGMYELINACSMECIRYIHSELEKNHSAATAVELEMKDLFTRFSNDVIATVAFGLQLNSFVHKNNEFYTVGQSLTHLGAGSMIKAVLYSIMPGTMKKLRFSMFKQSDIDYFKDLVFDAIKYRTAHNITRPDMLQLLLEAKRQFEQQQLNDTTSDVASDTVEFNDEDLLAQCVFFFFAGFETISITLCFASYELCMNPKVQSALFDEILAVQQRLQGRPLDHDTLKNMEYLDMVVSETLRKWPTGISTDRLCSKDFDLSDENNELVLSLKKGDVIQIPIFPIHHDPENFTQPEQFRPERFSAEHKHEIKPFTYLPFGVGPRNCIGNRLALMELKSIIYHLVLNFNLVPAQKTVSNMLQSIVGFRMQPKELFWLKCVPRKIN